MTAGINKTSLWIMAARPRTLTAGASPVIIGAATAYSEGFFVIWASLFALLSCMLLQIGTNLANDYFDAVNGIDDENRLGPVRVTQTGLIAPHRVKRAFIVCFAGAAVFGLPLVAWGGFPILAIGILSILFAYLYTGGPFPLAYIGLGEVLAFVFFGLVATGGVYYLNTHEVTISVMIAGAGPGFIAAFLMGVNNLRDIHTDRAAGKKTLAVILGEHAARRFVAGLLVASLCIPPLYLVFNTGQPLVLLASLGIVPFVPRFLKVFTARIDAGFNLILAAAGKYLLVYALLFAAGVLV